MYRVILAAFAAFCSMAVMPAFAHGVAGDRVFPATVAVEDPAVADELTLPQWTRFKGEDGVWTNSASFEFAKTITSKFGLSVGGTWLDPDNEASGWDNFELSAKYQLYRNDAHEFLLSVGLDDDMGGTGSKKVDAESFSTLTPTVFFGKGLGDMFDQGSYLRPLAVTGAVGYAMPTGGDSDDAPNTIDWGVTVQYSVPYLQQHVKDLNLSAPWDGMIPVVEFAMETPTQGEDSGRTTGTINPGIIWMGEKGQVALQAVLPINHDSGDGVGMTVQVHFFLDDLIPALGHPIW